MEQKLIVLLGTQALMIIQLQDQVELLNKQIEELKKVNNENK